MPNIARRIICMTIKYRMLYITFLILHTDASGEKLIVKQSQNGILSFLRKQESRVVGVPGFRIKCGMTTQELHSSVYALTIRVNPRLEIEMIIHLNFAKRTQFHQVSEWY